VHDEDMTPMDTSRKVKHKVRSFLCLHNNISKNLLLPNVDTFNVFREQFEDTRNLGETSYMTSIAHRMSNTPCPRFVLGCKTIKAEHSVRWQPSNTSLGRL
jgi:hypothetical protein